MSQITDEHEELRAAVARDWLSRNDAFLSHDPKMWNTDIWRIHMVQASTMGSMLESLSGQAAGFDDCVALGRCVGECTRGCERAALDCNLRYAIMQGKGCRRVEEVGVFPDVGEWRTSLGSDRGPIQTTDGVGIGRLLVREWRGVELSVSKSGLGHLDVAELFRAIVMCVADWGQQSVATRMYTIDRDGGVIAIEDVPNPDPLELDDFEEIDVVPGVLEDNGDTDYRFLFAEAWLQKEHVIESVRAKWSGHLGHTCHSVVPNVMGFIVMGQLGGASWADHFQKYMYLAEAVYRMRAPHAIVEAVDGASTRTSAVLSGSDDRIVARRSAISFLVGANRMLLISSSQPEVLQDGGLLAWGFPNAQVGQAYELRRKAFPGGSDMGFRSVIHLTDGRGADGQRAVLGPSDTPMMRYGLKEIPVAVTILDLKTGEVANATYLGVRSPAGGIIQPGKISTMSRIKDYVGNTLTLGVRVRRDWMDWEDGLSGGDCVVCLVVTALALLISFFFPSGVTFFVAAFVLSGSGKGTTHFLSMPAAVRAVLQRRRGIVGSDIFAHTMFITSFALVEVVYEFNETAAWYSALSVSVFWSIGWLCSLVILTRRPPYTGRVITRPINGGLWGITHAAPDTVEPGWSGYTGRLGVRCTEVDMVQVAHYGLGVGSGAQAGLCVSHCDAPLAWTKVSETVLCGSERPMG